MTYATLAAQISNIRYGALGSILFDCNGQTISIAEPTDVLLVGFSPALAARWIAQHYNFLLPTAVR